MTHRVRIHYTIAALWLLLSFGVQADSRVSARLAPERSCDTFQAISEPFTSSVLKVAPWGMINPNGELEGVLHNFFVEFSRQTGIPHTGYVAPYARVIHSVQRGQVDFSILHDAPYEGVIRIADALTMEVLLVGRAPAMPVLSLKELMGRRVGHVRTSKYGAEFDSADYLNKFPITDMKQGLAMLMKDRLDVTASVDRTLYWAMHHLEVAPEKVSLLYSLGEVPAGIYISSKSRYLAMVPCMQQTVAAMRASGALVKVFEYRTPTSPAWRARQELLVKARKARARN